MALVLIMGIGSMIFSFSINLFLANDQNDWFEKSSLNNKVLTPITVWIHAGLMVFFTVISFYTIFELREEARNLYKENEKEKCKLKDFEWLKARTLHVRGLLAKDRRGDMLKNEINLILEETGGKVLDIVAIPDY